METDIQSLYQPTDSFVADFKDAFPTGAIRYTVLHSHSIDSDGRKQVDMNSVIGLPSDGAIAAHINGKRGLGVVPIEDRDMSRWGVLDIDLYGDRIDVPALLKRRNELGLPLVAFRSKSGGLHLHLHFEQPISAAEMRRLLERLRGALALPDKGVETFPKQDALAEDGTGGTTINLPLFGASRPLVQLDEDGELVELRGVEAMAYLKASRVSAAALTELEQRLPPLPEGWGARKKPDFDPQAAAAADALNASTTFFSEGPPCLQAIEAEGKVGQGCRNDLLREMAVFIQYTAISDSGPLNQTNLMKELSFFNEALFTEPLPKLEIKAIAKSVAVHGTDVGYRCTKDPLKPYCNAAVCATRKFGAARRGLRPSVVPFDPDEANASVRDLSEALGEIDPPTIFVFNGKLSHVHATPRRDPYAAGAEDGQHSQSAWVVASHNEHTLSMAVQAAGVRTYARRSGRNLKDCDPPKLLMQKMLACPASTTRAPVLLGLAPLPIMRPDGSLVDTAGYDATTRTYYTGEAPKFSIPDIVSIEDARAAAAVLLEPFSEFRFRGEVDWGCVIALLLTLAQRPFLPTAPAIGISATKARTGKDLLAKCCGMIVYGHPITSVPFVENKREREEEDRKRLVTWTSQGLAAVVIENARDAVTSSPLEAALTSTETIDRRFGKNDEQAGGPNVLTIILTGNHLRMGGDMPARSITIMLDSGVENPQHRTFTRSLPGDILKDRPKLLAALYTIMRGWRQSGMPNKRPLGSFEDWSRYVSDVVEWLGYPNPIETQEEQAAQSEENLSRIGLLQAWVGLYGLNTKVEARDVVARVWPDVLDGTASEAEKRLREAFQEAYSDFAKNRGVKPTPQAFAMKIGAIKDAVYGNMHLCRHDGRTATWEVKPGGPERPDRTSARKPGSKA